MGYFLNCCVAAHLNIVVAGGTGSGKTTLLNVLAGLIEPHERIVTIEDSAELKITVNYFPKISNSVIANNDEYISYGGSVSCFSGTQAKPAGD